LHDGLVRAVRIALAGLLGLAGAVIGAPALIGAPAALAAGATIGLNPTHGTPGEAITITYRYVTAGGACRVVRTRVVLAWDGKGVAQTQLNRRCAVTARLRPPANDRAPGPHQVTALMPTVFGSRADAVYTIDRAMPTPTSMSADPQTTAVAGPTATAPATTDTTPALPAPAGTVGAAVADVRLAWVGWALIFGAALVLVGAGTLGLVIVRSRRERDPY
jgi:hypothetical protein